MIISFLGLNGDRTRVASRRENRRENRSRGRWPQNGKKSDTRADNESDRSEDSRGPRRVVKFREPSTARGAKRLDADRRVSRNAGPSTIIIIDIIVAVNISSFFLDNITYYYRGVYGGGVRKSYFIGRKKRREKKSTAHT